MAWSFPSPKADGIKDSAAKAPKLAAANHVKIIYFPQGRGSSRRSATGKSPQPGSALRAKINARCIAMRTTLDRVAVLLMISACCFGCRSGTGGGNMFAWGKKKPDAGGEAPKYESTTLPTAGQNPMNSLNQVAGNNTGNSAQPTGYQPS